MFPPSAEIVKTAERTTPLDQNTKLNRVWFFVNINGFTYHGRALLEATAKRLGIADEFKYTDEDIAQRLNAAGFWVLGTINEHRRMKRT